MEKPKVMVLLCTYNGEKYIEEQIDSILSQKDVNVFIKVADDCSTDKTVEILQRYKEKCSNFDYYVNQTNKNFTYNFLDLLFSVKDSDYDYYAFADQDDFWLEKKLISAINKIGETGENGKLYCSNLKLANEDLVEYGLSYSKRFLKLNKYNFIVSNIATGCTIVFDSKFFKHLIKYYPKDIKLHDYWTLLVAAFTSEYLFDYEAYILYRQHGNNQIGASKSLTKGDMLKKFFNHEDIQLKLITELLNGYSDYINEKDKKKLIIVRDYKVKLTCKLKLLFSFKIRRFKHNFLFKLCVLLNRF